jgi:hypothetical protein
LVDPYILEAILAATEIAVLVAEVIAQESRFVVSREIAPAAAPGQFQSGQARVLVGVDELLRRIASRFEAALPRVLDKFQMSGFRPARLDGQLAAVGRGGALRYRSAPPGAELTWVFMFHRESKAFSGGDLQINGVQLVRGQWVPSDAYRSVPAGQGRLALFPSRYPHQLAQVTGKSGAFADSLFALTGWLIR